MRLLGVALLAFAGLAAASPGEEARQIVFYSPSEREPAWGDTEVEVDVWVDGVSAVVFQLDGLEVGRLERAPYRITVPVGDSFEGHLFEAIALGPGGREIARGAIETPALRIDEHIDLGLQQLYVTIDRAEGEVAGPLDPDEFRVVDNGVSQEIVTFERGDAALTVALLVDASDSMRGGRLEAALEGARAFLEEMRELDEAALYLFADSVRFRSPFLDRADALARRLEAIEAGGGTAINDTLYLAIRQLEARQGRRVVVLLSDGSDIHSALGIDKVLWSMRRSRSLIYWIALDDGEAERGKSSPWRTSDRHRREREGLRRLVSESGGRVVPLAAAAEAAAAFGDILTELRSQYVLGYYPSHVARDGKWHEVEVRVARRGFRARTRDGYVAD